MSNGFATSHPGERRGFTDALLGLVLGLISVCGSFVGIIGLACGAAGMFFSVLGRTREVTPDRRLASAGLVLSIIGTVLGAIITTWWVIAGVMGYGWTIVMHAGWMEVFK